MTVGDLGEDAVVARLTRLLAPTASVIAGPGDDCAVVRSPGEKRCTVLKTDAVVEWVHFEPSTKPELVGRKALARVVSDFAAMGATPRHALVTVVCPQEMKVARLEAMYRGMQKLAGEFGMAVVGGELTKGLAMMISVAVEGDVAAEKWRSRSGAQAGDALLVTGRLGGSLGGRHLTFQPRLEEGRWLAGRAGVHAMMDLSDGLARDLPRMAKASDLAFEVAMDRLPRHRGCDESAAWGDGEDYELLIAVERTKVGRVMTAWKKRFPKLGLTEIGRLIPGEAGSGNVAKGGGWDPFQIQEEAK